MNMMTTDTSWTEGEDSAVSKLVAAWERKLSKNGAKAAGLGLMAVSLAACGDSDSNDTDTGDTGGDTGGDTTPTTTVVDGATIDLAAYDGSANAGDTTIELKGNTDPNVDGGEWINYETLLVRDANGDITITDIQATETDASDGAAGTEVILEDIGQNTAGTVTINFDTQAVDEADTVVNLSVDEVAGNVSLTANTAIETVNVSIDDGTNEASDIDTFFVTDITTLTLMGGIADQSFTIDNALNASITTLDASAAVADLDLDVTGGGTGTYSLGSGDDMLEMGDSYNGYNGVGDTISGGDGADTVAMNFAAATIREGTMSGVETLNAVFGAAATFDGSFVDDLTTVNLGLDGFDAAVETASAADADFNDMDATFTTLNIHATQIDVEVDYENDADGDLTINFGNDSGTIFVGDNVADTAIQLIDVKDLTINQISDNGVFVLGEIDLDNNETETLTITTSQEGGDLTLSSTTVGAAAIVNTDDLTDVSISALNGDMDLNDRNGNFIVDAEELQTYRVTAEDADVQIGAVGASAGGEATELEIIELEMVDEATLAQNIIVAYDTNLNVGANISLFDVTASDKNTVAFAGPNLTSANVVVSGLFAEQVDNLVVDAADDGNVILNQQEYTLNTATFTGTGDIEIIAAGTLVDTGLDQTQAVDASGHSGARFFDDGDGADTFFGSNQADTVTFDTGGVGNVYNDAGGVDTVSVSGTTSVTVNDNTGTGSSDIYSFTGFGTNVFNVGGGNDTVDADNVFGSLLIDFASYENGLLSIDNFTTGGLDQLSFDGFGAITAGAGVAAPAGGPATNMNANSVYVFANGDAIIAPRAASTIADYTNLTDVADYLDGSFLATQNVGDEAIFIINNGDDGGNTGDEDSAYVYYYVEAGTAGIQDSELTLIASLDMGNSTTFTAGNIIAADVM